MVTASCLGKGSPNFCSFCISISMKQHDLLTVRTPVACCLQMVAEIVKDATLSDFAWILRPMDEKTQTLWMSGEFVTTAYSLTHASCMSSVLSMTCKPAGVQQAADGSQHHPEGAIEPSCFSRAVDAA